MNENQDVDNDPAERRDAPHIVDAQALDTAVLAEQVDMLYQSAAVLPINLTNAILAAYILRSIFPAWALAAWVASFAVVISARLYDFSRYRRQKRPIENARNWGLRYTVGATATGCLWGLMAFVPFSTADPAYYAFTAFVVGGMTAGGLIKGSAYLPAMIGFAAPTILPPIIASFANPNLTSLTMGFMLASFAVALALIAYRTNYWITSIFRRKIIQAALTADLEAEISRRKQVEREMSRVMRTDSLTSLPNRVAFMEWVSKAFHAAKDGSRPFAILCLDVDRFKDVNATLGHSIGDELLKAVAERIASALHGAYPVARIGGDEFGIFLSEVENHDSIGSLAEKIIQLMHAPHVVGGSQIHTSVSIGVSVYRADMAKPEEMMREASLALDDAKERGRNRYLFHSHTHDLAVRERVTLEEDIKSALDRKEFEVYYQPEVEWPTGRIVGLEALLRWNHPRHGLILPGDFTSVAERTASIVPLGHWVLTSVIQQLRAWRDEGIEPQVTAINVSAVQLVPPFEFDRDLARELAAQHLNPKGIELELTESALIESTREQSDLIDRLRALGVRIAIDDFGTGYSSLEYLLAYRVNRIKIAQQFVRRLPDDKASATIVRATIGLAREFEVDIVAEGVETPEQLEFLVASGCRIIQGYYFSPPVPAAQAAELLRRRILLPESVRLRANVTPIGG